MAGYLGWSRTRVRPQPSGGRLMLAVLPFENLTGDAGQDYFSDGMTEEMIAQLGHLDPEHLGVIARTSVMHYKHGQEQLGQIGRELAVQYVLEGSVRRDSGKVRITAQLVQMKEQMPVWSRQYDRELSGLLALQGEIAQEIADEIQPILGSDRKHITADRKSSPSPSSYEAYDLYLKGRYFWNKRTKEGFQQAAEYFQQAIVKDPNYARAYVGLADTFGLMSTWSLVPQNEFMPKAREAALKALQIDPSMAEAHASLALVAEHYDYDWQTAEKEFRQAIQLDPGYGTARQWYAECLSFQGRFDEALAESERARQLDPLSVIIARDHGTILYFSRQYDRAIEQFRAVRKMDPDFPRSGALIEAYVLKRQFADALAELGKPHTYGSAVSYWSYLAYVYGRSGQRLQSQRAVARLELLAQRSPSDLTLPLLVAYVGSDRKDEVIALLQKAYSEHSNAVVTLKVEPYYDPLRGDPRFQDLLRRVGLADSNTTGKSTSKP
jgi:TolB-like protein/Tfp pilus assembly protein PilF